MRRLVKKRKKEREIERNIERERFRCRNLERGKETEI